MDLKQIKTSYYTNSSHHNNQNNHSYNERFKEFKKVIQTAEVTKQLIMVPTIRDNDENLSDTEEVFEEAVEEQDIEFDSDILQIASEEIGENETIRQESVQEMRRWVEAQPHFVNVRTDANFLCRFLRTNKFKMEKSCQMLERYIKMRMSHPKWFQNLDVEVRCKLSYLCLCLFIPRTLWWRS